MKFVKYALAIFAVALQLCACKSEVMNYQQTDAYLARLNRKTEALKNKILNAASDIHVKGKIYYVSAEGNDAWNGESLDKPFRTIDKINMIPLHSGDAVLFRRGDLFRGGITARQGVTYSAYGKGEKPKIYGSPCDAAKEGKWIETDVSNVYMYDRELPKDVGTLVFNHGESCAFKVMMRRDLKTGRTTHIETGEPFSSYRDLKRDMDFYHDYTGTKRIYLCSTKGNPSDRFASIELPERKHIIYVYADSVTVDNLCLKYGGAHGVGIGKHNHITVTNCEIGWIGGSVQYDKPEQASPVRYGNGIELWGGHDYKVDHCYIYQVYDAGITHQYVPNDARDTTFMTNVSYTNNLVERCTYSLEYFLAMPAEGDSALFFMDHITAKNNIFRYSGFGWGTQRPNKGSGSHIKSWEHYNKAFHFLIENNVFDRARYDMLYISATKAAWLPELKNNTYIQYENASLCRFGAKKTKPYVYDKNAPQTLRNVLGEHGARVFFLNQPLPAPNPLNDYSHPQ
jgi:hypothetical protein